MFGPTSILNWILPLIVARTVLPQPTAFALSTTSERRRTVSKFERHLKHRQFVTLPRRSASLRHFVYIQVTFHFYKIFKVGSRLVSFRHIADNVNGSAYYLIYQLITDLKNPSRVLQVKRREEKDFLFVGNAAEVYYYTQVYNISL